MLTIDCNRPVHDMLLSSSIILQSTHILLPEHGCQCSWLQYSNIMFTILILSPSTTHQCLYVQGTSTWSMAHPHGSTAHPHGSMAHPHGSMAHPHGPWHIHMVPWHIHMVHGTSTWSMAHPHGSMAHPHGSMAHPHGPWHIHMVHGTSTWSMAHPHGSMAHPHGSTAHPYGFSQPSLFPYETLSFDLHQAISAYTKF